VSENTLLSVRNLTVVSNGKAILKDVTLDIERGEIHVLAGDHNSGKNALAEVISGVNGRYMGSIFFENRLIARPSPRKAMDLGIETIHEIPRVLPALSVLENVFPLARVSTGPVFSNRPEMERLAREKITLFSPEIDLASRMDRCNDDERVAVCLARSLCRPFKLLVVNDISSRLTPKQVDVFHGELSAARAQGTTVLYVTSHIEEVHNFADRISLFHHGKLVTTQRASNLNKFDLVQLSISHLNRRKELSRMNFELAYLSNFYENIINSIPIPMLIMNSQKDVVSVNDSFATIYSVSKKDYLNANVRTIFASDCFELLNFKANSSISSGKVEKLEKVRLLINGRVRRADVYAIPIYDEDDSFLGSILFFDKSRVDISLQKYYGLTSANKAIPFFAHEIRNPLAIINNLMKLMKQKSQSSQFSEYLTKSENEIKRIKAIVNNLIRERNFRATPSLTRSVELKSIVDEVVGTLTPSCTKNGIRLTHSAPPGMFVNYDQGKLREVLVNLVLNAIEAVSKKGRISVDAGYETVQKERQVLIRVADNGIGIDKEMVNQIFEPFYTTKKGKERRGLGLSICKDIVVSWGGTITVDSKGKHGSVFSVHLPA
jgi:nitrogen-specific signal transduction histidine kinase/ABC-type branched-subunit amino acid transport system ATPase component